ncbi:MAG: O-methyltransferase [Tannerellaceae bacterium]|nr:O-methyltransferase [Tannerellaceae bacterium]
MRGMEEYILTHIDEEGELLSSLRREAHVKLLRPRMLSGHLQGRVLKMFCRMIRPRRVLEIGTYTGYSTLCMAEGMESGTELHTVEINDEMELFIRHYVSLSPDREKIRLHFGDALEVVPCLGGEFDMVFLDGGKHQYSAYYEMVFRYLRLGGFIVADNTLWDGKVAHPPSPMDKQTSGIIAFNELISQDRRVEKVILPLRDGLTVIRKSAE